MNSSQGRTLALLLAGLAAAGCAGTSSTTEWPAPGYVWRNPNATNDLSTRWEPGIGYFEQGTLTKPNIKSSFTVGQWHPAPGYVWARLDSNGRPIPGELAVVWKPGQSYWDLGSVKFPNLHSAGQEGQWWPAPGYVWAKLDEKGNPISGEMSVKWQPGRPFYYLGEVKWPHVVAAPTEGRWLPEQGYGWARRDRNGNPIPGQLQVASLADLQAQRAREQEFLAQEKALQDRWAAYLREIQSQNDYGNWSSPPHDLFLARRAK